MTTDPASRRGLPGATMAQLKADIDGGRTGDKTAGFDPGAAPLGTDEEAGGHATSPDMAALARAQESTGRARRAAANAAEPDLAPDARLGRQPGMFLAAVAGVGIGGLLGLLFLAAL